MTRFRVRRVGGVISTDDILPARYKHASTDPAELAGHIFEYRLEQVDRRFQPGDCIVADSIFGIGSSREQAVSALLAAGIGAVFAPAFGRIFFRNAWNLGLAAIEIELPSVRAGDVVDLDLERSWIDTPQGGKPFAPVAPEIIEMHKAGGLLPMLVQELSAAAPKQKETA